MILAIWLALNSGIFSRTALFFALNCNTKGETTFIRYIHFEISDDLGNLIGSQQWDFFANCFIFCSKLQH